MAPALGSWVWCLGDGGDIRYLGDGGDWFRPYGESLSKSAKVTKALLPLSFGASLWLGMPSLRSCSVGPPPSAILGRARLTRHPCRVTHCAEPALGLSRGRLPPQPPRRPESRPGSLVYALSFSDAFTHSRHVHQSPVGAGLPAMDVNDDAGCLDERGCLGVFCRQAGSYRESCVLLIFTTHQAER